MNCTGGKAPDTYVVVPNNDHIRPRFMLVYVDRKGNRAGTLSALRLHDFDQRDNHILHSGAVFDLMLQLPYCQREHCTMRISSKMSP